MTTDELVATIISALKHDPLEIENVYGQHARSVKREWYGELLSETYSVALNDETRDVRYVTSISAPGSDFEGEVFEVSPVTVLRTEYRRK